MGYILPYQQIIRLICFFGMLFLMICLELRFPRRQLHYSKKTRWINNLSLVSVNTILVYLLLPGMAIGTALIAEQKSWGLFYLIPGYYWLKVVIAFLIFDFMIYLQHVIFHLVPLFWRFHRMHHTDLDLDVTSGLRFHPIEIFLSMLIKMIIVVIIGAPVLSVVLFEIVLNATSMFNHSNILIPIPIDRYLRWFFVTPDMHRVHHSVIIKETNQNFGFNFPWWDRLCRTYTAQPTKGHLDMVIGLGYFRDKKYLNLGWLILIPFIHRRR